MSEQSITWPTPIKDLTEASAPAADDFILGDGATNGTRKIAALKFPTVDSSPTTWGGLHVFNNRVAMGIGYEANAQLTLGVDQAAGLTWVPLRFATSPLPSLVATPVPGALETNGTDLYFTNAAGVRKKVTLT